jgi:hypothetical protein
MSQNRTIGFWIIMLLGLVLLGVLLVGQTMSVIDYQFTVSIGLQESVDLISEMGVAVNKAFGVGDTMPYIPFLTLGLVGLWFRKDWGVFTMVSALAITVYWPIVNIFIVVFSQGSPGFHLQNTTSYAIVLSAIAFYGLWGLWYLYKNRKVLTQKKA